MRDRRSRSTDEGGELDPVPLSIAVWLGLIAGVSGISRLSEDAIARASLARAEAAMRAPAGFQASQESRPPRHVMAAGP